MAKVKVILKRYGSSTEKNTVETADGFTIDYEALRVFKEGKDVGLKNKEFKLFVYLFQNKGKVITKDELFAKVWGDAFFSDGTLNVHIRKIREKIEDNPNCNQRCNSDNRYNSILHKQLYFNDLHFLFKLSL